MRFKVISSPSLTALTASKGSRTIPRDAFTLENSEIKVLEITLCIPAVNALAFIKAFTISLSSLFISVPSGVRKIWLASIPVMS